ncbi:MAG: hypothetical protein HYZ28_12395 [Myxococcales bacterium]|nr:hypothetical protein [Myxococcales bacterium]
MPLLAAWASLAPAAGRSGTTGSFDVQGQATRILGETPNGTTQASTAALLQENLTLHYAGLPFGPAVALITAGAGLTNVNAAPGLGLTRSGRTASFDVSAGFLPRRSLPIRVFARGALPSGDQGHLATIGPGPSLAYGASLNLEPGLLPGLRVDFEEARTTGFLTREPLTDLRRVVSLGSSRSIGGHHLNLTARLDQFHPQGLPGYDSYLASFSWLSAHHQSQLLATQIDRGAVSLLGLTRERDLHASHVQVLGDRLTADAAAHAGEVAAPNDARGSRSDARLGVTYRPLAGEQLLVSSGLHAGLTSAQSPTVSRSGRSYGASLRGSYARPWGPLNLGLSAGGGLDTCQCEFGNSGTQARVDGGLTVGALAFHRGNLQASYNLGRVFAPPTRGGDRLEHQVQANGSYRPRSDLELRLNVGYDDRFRELVDLASAQSLTLHERALGLGAGASKAIGQGAVSADLRHARGSVLVPEGGSQFVSGFPSSAQSITSAVVSGLTPIGERAHLNLQLHGTWTSIGNGPPLATLFANAGFTFAFGRLSTSLTYQLTRSTVGELATVQHEVRGTLSRPFEL